MNLPSQWLAALPSDWFKLTTASGFAAGIIVIALITVLAQIWEHFRYRRELGWISTAQRQIELETNGGDLELLTPEYSEAVIRLRAVASCGEKGFPPSLADLNEAVEAREDSTFVNRFQNVVLSTLLIVGLLGTLWSLQPALRSPGKLFTKDGVDTAQVDAYVKQVQDGMGGAFTASICGLLCTVVLVFTRGLFVMGKRNELFAALDTFTVICLIPRFVPSPISPPKALREASSRLDAVSGKLDSIVTNLSTAATNTKISTTTLDAFVAKLNTAAATMERIFAESGTVKVTLQSFRDTTAKLEKLHAGQIAEAVADRKQIATAISGMNDAVKGIREMQGTVIDTLKTVDTNQAATVTSYEAALSAFKKEAQGWLNAMREEGNKRSQEIAATLTAVQSNQAGTVTAYEAALNALKNEAQGWLRALREDENKRSQEIADTLSAVQSNQAGTVTAYQQALTALEKQVEAWIKTMEEQTQTRAHEIAAVLKVVSDSGSRLETAGADVSKAASDILASSEAQKGTTQTLATHLGEASNKQNEALKDVIARLGSLESLEKRLSEFPNTISSNVPRPCDSIPSQGIEPSFPSSESTIEQTAPTLGIVSSERDDLAEGNSTVALRQVSNPSPDYSTSVDSLPVTEVDTRHSIPENSGEQPSLKSVPTVEHQVEVPTKKKGLLSRFFSRRK